MATIYACKQDSYCTGYGSSISRKGLLSCKEFLLLLL
ncbi:unnamed protein product [Lathyrus sativus]|nr:unnamed protein product [Lathyrus sativus]